MQDSLLGIFNNKIIVTCFFSWLIAQTIKVITIFKNERKLKLKAFFYTGGMPSSHSSTVTTLTMMVGFTNGFNSTSFAISLVFALIVMSDAAGVRRAAGEQAKVLNEIIYMIEHKRKLTGEKLKEFLGHTPLQVFFGCLLGIIVALVSNFVFIGN